MIRPTVVVGVDQSPQSRAALQWAAEYARSTGSSLRVVSVHPHWNPALPYAVGVAGIPLTNQQAWDEQAHSTIDQLFDSVRPEPHWTLTQIEGNPGPDLVRAAQGASLLVVGTREHTGFDRFLEGSTSHYCLRHADVPVVAVPLSVLVAPAADQPVASVAPAASPAGS